MTQRRVLIFSAVMGAFFFVTDSGFSGRHKRYASINVVFNLSAAFLEVVFELKIFNYAGFDFDAVMYFRIFSINPFIGPSIYF